MGGLRAHSSVASPGVGALFRAPGAVPDFEPGLGASWPEGAVAGVRGGGAWGAGGPDLDAPHASAWPGSGFAGHWGGTGACRNRALIEP
jgi:hypothetical protein